MLMIKNVEFIMWSLFYLKDKTELRQVKAMAPDMAVFFVKCNRNASAELTDSMTESGRNYVIETMEQRRADVNQDPNIKTGSIPGKTKIFEQLCELGYLSLENEETKLQANEQSTNNSMLTAIRPKSNLIEDFKLFPCFLLFVRQVLKYNVVSAATVLNEAHVRVLGMFITTAFDMARDMVVTPRRLDYAREKEEDLFNALMESASRKQEEIKDLIHNTITSLSPEILDEVEHRTFEGVKVLPNGELSNPKDLQYCVTVIQELVLARINNSVAEGLISSVKYLQENFVGTLKRCIECLEKIDRDGVYENGESATSSLRHVSS